MGLEQELKTTSDELLRKLEQLRELELEKREQAPGSARFQKLAREIERLAATVLSQTVKQERLGEKTAERREETGLTPPPPIAEVTPRRELSLILGEWREAERRLGATASGTSEHLEAQAAVARLRSEYREAHGATADDPREG